MPGEELYVHYGPSYAPRRDYPVGEPAKLRKKDLPAAQLPANVDWLRALPLASWEERL